MSIQGLNRSDLSSLVLQQSATRSGNSQPFAEKLASAEKSTPTEPPQKPERKAPYSEIMFHQRQTNPTSREIHDNISVFIGRPSPPQPTREELLEASKNRYAREGSFDHLNKDQKHGVINTVEAHELLELGKLGINNLPTTKSVTRLALEFDTNFNNTISLEELENFKNDSERIVMGEENAQKIQNKLKLADNFIQHYKKIAALDGNDGISQKDIYKLSNLSPFNPFKNIVTKGDYVMLYYK